MHARPTPPLSSINQRWLLKNGLTVAFVFLSIFCLLAITIPYPEKIETRVIIGSDNGPTPIISNTGGKITALKIRNNQQVIKGQELALIESETNLEQTLKLETELYKISRLKYNENSTFDCAEYNEMGNLQQPLENLCDALASYQLDQENQYFYKLQQSITKDVERLKEKKIKLKNELIIKNELLGISEHIYGVSQELLTKKAISNFDELREKEKLLERKTFIQQSEALVIQNDNTISEKEIQLKTEEYLHKQKYVTLKIRARKLLNGIQQWKHNYIIKSAMDGRIALTSYLERGQLIKEKQTIGFIIPHGSKYYGQTVLNQPNLARVRKGQSVYLRFDAYPYLQYGEMPGRIDEISQIPGENGYLTKISIPQNLTTDSKTRVTYREGLTATGLIITDDLTIAERLWYSLLKKKEIR